MGIIAFIAVPIIIILLIFIIGVISYLLFGYIIELRGIRLSNGISIKGTSTIFNTDIGHYNLNTQIFIDLGVLKKIIDKLIEEKEEYDFQYSLTETKIAPQTIIENIFKILEINPPYGYFPKKKRRKELTVLINLYKKIVNEKKHFLTVDLDIDNMLENCIIPQQNLSFLNSITEYDNNLRIAFQICNLSLSKNNFSQWEWRCVSAGFDYPLLKIVCTQFSTVPTQAIVGKYNAYLLRKQGHILEDA